MTLRARAGLLPLCLMLAAAGQTAAARERGQIEYQEEFSEKRGCANTYGAEYKLVRAFILAMAGYWPLDEQFSAGAPYAVSFPVPTGSNCFGDPNTTYPGQYLVFVAPDSQKEFRFLTGSDPEAFKLKMGWSSLTLE